MGIRSWWSSRRMTTRSPLEFVHSMPSRAAATLSTSSVPARLMAAASMFMPVWMRTWLMSFFG